MVEDYKNELDALASVVHGLSDQLDSIARRLGGFFPNGAVIDQDESHCNPDEDDEGNADEPTVEYIESFRTVSQLPDGFKGRRVRRDVKDVVALVVHQTAVSGGFGVTRASVERSGSELLARLARYRSTPYHALYSPADRASIVQWPLWAHGYHGNRSNAYSIGWSYDGRFPGDALHVDQARQSLAHVVSVAREVGAPLQYVEAHRQHSAQRGGDPGLEIWRDVVLPMLPALGLSMRPTHTTGDGLPLPDAWMLPPSASSRVVEQPSRA